jgi:hypothetical protein
VTTVTNSTGIDEMKNDKHPFKAGMAWALFRVCYEAGLQYFDPEEPGDWYPEPEKGWEAFIGLDETRHGFRRKLTKEVDGHPQAYTQRFLVDLFIDVNGEAEEELADYPENPFFEELVAKAEALFKSELASGQQHLYQDITQEEFADMLGTVAAEYNGAQLLIIPGVYEALAEHFNNEVLRRLRGGAE